MGGRLALGQRGDDHATLSSSAGVRRPACLTDWHLMGTNQRKQIVMTDDEITDFVARHRTGTMATVGPDGQPHLVAMWYGFLDGKPAFETLSARRRC